MRNSRKKSKDGPREEHSTSLQMELDLIAIKAKNSELVKTNIKLVQSISEMKNDMFALRAELVEIQAKYNNMKSVWKNVEQKMKQCTPSLIDILNLFLEVTDNKKNNHVNQNPRDRLSVKGFTPKAKATHSVVPHAVNGTVLNLVPSISLTRMTNINETSNLDSRTNISVDNRNSLPSTSTNAVEENISQILNNSEIENHSFVSRRKHTNSVPANSDSEYGDDVDSDIPSSDESNQQIEENLNNLSTIQEESFLSSTNRRTSLERGMILGSQFTEDSEMESQNTSLTSIEAQANDTCLNIDTDLSENRENRVKQRTSADIMIFSPHTNSTRMESDNFLINESSKLSVPVVSSIQSIEVTPEASAVNGNGEMNTEYLTWLPTPSISKLGDIDRSNTKLEILKDLGLSPSNSNRTENDNPTSPYSSRTPQRITRSSGGNSRSRCIIANDSSSIENQRGKRSTANSVKNYSHETDPVIIIERLPEHLLTTKSINIQTLEPAEERKLNQKLPKKSKSNKKSSKSKKSVKRKHEEENEPCEASLQEKIKEIQIRLSSYLPECLENSVESHNENSRPVRKARPTSLKDASLKVKLRRLI